MIGLCDQMFREVLSLGNLSSNWINDCYMNISNTIINNGKTWGLFKITGGVKLGCPLWTTLFILFILYTATDPNETK